MDIDCVAVFVEATRAGSLAAAARKLGLVPMGASRRLAALEAELDVRLVHRTTRALALTAEGEAFLPYAEAMIEDAANARAAVRPSASGVAGLLRVTASEPFGRKVISAMLPGFLATNPDLRVDLQLTDGLVDIVAAGVDVAIRIAPLRDSSLVARRLADSPRRLYASPDYLASAGIPRRLADLAAHQCLLFSGATHWTFVAGERIRRLRVTGRCSSNSIEALHEACLRGLGLALLAEWNAADDVTAGRLVPLPLEDAEPETLGIWAVYPSARLVPPKVRLFVEALKSHLGSGRGQPESG
ncbi:LysR family transcriptional regulator [Pleomorphomonas diazotrophica]|uniref:LysR family transcriptional regulator n=1 Tax=Pleomorphomonas diazotrophica TaxID=1166257 RepID=A0A1I4U9L5_9HYPH|nr:LysR family transcriptional regulator [Pleomorphomonas diazotrophica]PKR91265.1 LysR family transcriptional regulator [Pleomorphomonas diazotrophica]SFM85689.1 DNA-binding transcriptional regulator, LysR family [Pleomorphomonas diazotrophica]